MDALDSDSAKKPLPVSRHAETFYIFDDAETLRRKRLCAMLAAEFGASAMILPPLIERR